MVDRNFINLDIGIAGVIGVIVYRLSGRDGIISALIFSSVPTRARSMTFVHLVHSVTSVTFVHFVHLVHAQNAQKSTCIHPMEVEVTRNAQISSPPPFL